MISHFCVSAFRALSCSSRAGNFSENAADIVTPRNSTSCHEPFYRNTTAYGESPLTRNGLLRCFTFPFFFFFCSVVGLAGEAPKNGTRSLENPRASFLFASTCVTTRALDAKRYDFVQHQQPDGATTKTETSAMRQTTAERAGHNYCFI